MVYLILWEGSKKEEISNVRKHFPPQFSQVQSNTSNGLSFLKIKRCLSRFRDPTVLQILHSVFLSILYSSGTLSTLIALE